MAATNFDCFCIDLKMDSSREGWVHISSFICGRKLLIDMRNNKMYMGNLAFIDPNMDYVELANVTDVYNEKLLLKSIRLMPIDIRSVMLVNGNLAPPLPSRALVQPPLFTSKRSKDLIFFEQYDDILKGCALFPSQIEDMKAALQSIQHIHRITGRLNNLRFTRALDDIKRHRAIFIDVEVYKAEPQFLTIFTAESKNVYIIDRRLIKLEGIRRFLESEHPTKIVHNIKRVKFLLSRYFQTKLFEPVATCHFHLKPDLALKNQDDRPVTPFMNMVEFHLRIRKDFFGDRTDNFGTDIDWRELNMKKKQLAAKKVIVNKFLYTRMYQEGVFNVFFKQPNAVESIVTPKPNNELQVRVEYLSLIGPTTCDIAHIEQKLKFNVPKKEWQESSEYIQY